MTTNTYLIAPSPSELHTMEMELAKSPTFDNCIRLSEAYLAAKRYMEASVVCRKGIKLAPRDPRGRITLARIFVDQGKRPQAVEELRAVLRDSPDEPTAREMLNLLTGEGGQPPVSQAPAAPSAAAPPSQGFAPPAQYQPPAQPQPRMAPGPAWPPAPVTPKVPLAPPAMPMANAGSGAAKASLEHASNIFDPSTLGFQNDTPDIETAGPGRLTIHGFVPGPSGSLRKTLLILAGVVVCAGVFLAYELINAQNTKAINKLFGEVRTALDEDRYPRYLDAVHRCDDILKIDSKHNLGLSAAAYAYAVLGTEHRVDGALDKAHDLLHRAEKATDKENEFRVAAAAMLALAAHHYDEGIAAIKKVQKEGGTSPLIELEAFRLMNAAAPDAKDTQLALLRVVSLTTSQARIFNALGWYYYGRDDWARADENFDRCRQNSKGHLMAVLGQALVDLDRNIALKERQTEIAANLKQIFALPTEDLSKPVLATAYFARARLLQWQGKSEEAGADYAKAFELDGQNPMFYLRRAQAYLHADHADKAILDLQKVVELEPNDVRAARVLIAALTKAGRFADADSALQKLKASAPTDFSLKLLEGDKLRAAGKPQEALTIYRAVTPEAVPELQATAHLGISASLRAMGQTAQAVKAIEDFLGAAPAGLGAEMEAKMWGELGQSYEALHNRDKALVAYNNCIDKYRYLPDCHYFACKLLGGGEGAQEACKAYLALDPNGKFAADAQNRVK